MQAFVNISSETLESIQGRVHLSSEKCGTVGLIKGLWFNQKHDTVRQVLPPAGVRSTYLCCTHRGAGAGSRIAAQINIIINVNAVKRCRNKYAAWYRRTEEKKEKICEMIVFIKRKHDKK